MSQRSTFPPITTFEGFRNAVSAYRLPRILLAALDLDLCTVIGERRWTIPQLAKKLAVSERGLSILCRNLAMAGVMVKQGESYWNSRLGATALYAGQMRPIGAIISISSRVIGRTGAAWTSLCEPGARWIMTPEEPDYRRRFTWAMHYRTLETVPKIAAQVDLRGAATLLDLGGGPGTYAMAFLAKNPGLRAAVGDRPAAL